LKKRNKYEAQQWRAARAGIGIHFNIREWPVGQTLLLLAGPLAAIPEIRRRNWGTKIYQFLLFQIDFNG